MSMTTDPTILGSLLDSVLSAAFAVMGFVFAVAALGLYLLPSVVAVARRHHTAATIVVLNVLLGWLFIGWVVSLALSLTETRQPAPAYPILPVDNDARTANHA
jgi:low temperature requirement protein LtrA